MPPQVGHERSDLNIPANIDPLAWSLATPSPSPTYVSVAITAPPEREKPYSKLQYSPPLAGKPPIDMAYQQADPRPFVSRTLVWQDIVNRPMMVRAVASRRAQRRNEDLAIVTINPLPGNVLDFEVVDKVLREFFEARRVVITDI